MRQSRWEQIQQFSLWPFIRSVALLVVPALAGFPGADRLKPGLQTSKLELLEQIRAFGCAGVGAVLTAGLFSGCCHLPAGKAARAQPAAEAHDLTAGYIRCDEFACQPLSDDARDDFIVHHLELTPVTAGTNVNRTLRLEHFSPLESKRCPVILILPISGGDYELERYFAARFARRGWSAIILHRELRTSVVRLEDIDVKLQQSVWDARRVIDWIETRPEMDAERIALFGVSLGGIKGALVAAVEPRIKAAVLGLTGGNLPHILTHSPDRGIVRHRNVTLQELNLDLPAFHEQARQFIRFDPLSYANLVNPRNVLLVLGAFDRVVPAQTGWELRQEMGKPETILLPTGHYTALLYLPYIQHAATRFIAERFEPGSELNRNSVVEQKKPSPAGLNPSGDPASAQSN